MRRRTGPGMAIHATQIGVRALHVGRGIDRDALAPGILQSDRRPMTDQTLRRRLRPCWQSRKNQKQKDRENKSAEAAAFETTQTKPAAKPAVRRQIRAGPHNVLSQSSGAASGRVGPEVRIRRKKAQRIQSWAAGGAHHPPVGRCRAASASAAAPRTTSAGCECTRRRL